MSILQRRVRFYTWKGGQDFLPFGVPLRTLRRPGSPGFAKLHACASTIPDDMVWDASSQAASYTRPQLRNHCAGGGLNSRSLLPANSASRLVHIRLASQRTYKKKRLQVRVHTYHEASRRFGCHRTLCFVRGSSSGWWLFLK